MEVECFMKNVLELHTVFEMVKVFQEKKIDSKIDTKKNYFRN